jgi:hypothetical protein
MPNTTEAAVISTGPRCTVRGRRTLSDSGSWSGLVPCPNRASEGPSGKSQRRRCGYGRWLSDKAQAGRAERLDAGVDDQIDRKRRLRGLTPVHFHHPLAKPARDLRTRSDKAPIGIWIGCLDVNDGEYAAIWHPLMPAGLSRDPGILQSGFVFIPACALQLVPSFAIKILLPHAQSAWRTRSRS